MTNTLRSINESNSGYNVHIAEGVSENLLIDEINSVFENGAKK